MAKWKLVLCLIGLFVHLDVHAIAMELYFEGTFVDLEVAEPTTQPSELLGKRVSGSIRYETEFIPSIRIQGPFLAFREGYIYAGSDQEYSGAAIDEWMTVEVFIDGERLSLPIFPDDDFAIGHLQHDDNYHIAGSNEYSDLAWYFYERHAQSAQSEQKFYLDLFAGYDARLNHIPGFNIPNLLQITSPFDISAEVLGIGSLERRSNLDEVPILEPIIASFVIERLKLSAVVPIKVTVPLPAIAITILGLTTLVLFVSPKRNWPDNDC